MEPAVTQIGAEGLATYRPDGDEWLRFDDCSDSSVSDTDGLDARSESKEISEHQNHWKLVRCDDHRNVNPCSGGWPPTTPHMGGLHRIPAPGAAHRHPPHASHDPRRRDR